MSLQVSQATIRDICEPFENSNPKIAEWCGWMANFHATVKPGVVPVEEGVVLNSAQKVAILGARRVFNEKCVELLSPVVENPDYDTIVRVCHQYVLHIEGSLIPLSSTLEKFLKRDKSVAIGQILTPEPGLNIVSNANASYAKLVDFIETTFIADTALYKNKGGENLTDDRYKLLLRIDVDPNVQTINFSNWNEIIVTALMQRFNYDDLGKVRQEKKQDVLTKVEALLRSRDFNFITLEEINRILEVFHSLVFNYILSSKKVEILPVKKKGKDVLKPNEVKIALKGVTFPGVHPLISGPVEAILHRNLTSQFKGVTLENKLLPELSHTIEEKFKAARVHQGHRVGIIAAMAVGEDASQAGLRSFHHAGVSGATGFDRVKQVTDNPNLDKVTDGFTIIAIKGNPDEIQAQLYAHLIEETRISDICEIVVGRRDDQVPEISESFGETPIFYAEPNGWQDRYVQLQRLLPQNPDSKANNQRRPSFDRPAWILRLRLDKAKMYQKRITPAVIAEIIESTFKNMRVIPSDFSIGLIDIYVDTARSDMKTFGIADDYAKLTMQALPMLNGKIIQGVRGFSKAFIEKFDLTTFITSIRPDENGFIVSFNTREVKINGVSLQDLTIFMRNKVGNNVELTPHPDMSFEVRGFEGNLREKILAPETVKLSDLIVSKEENDNVLTITLNPKKLLAEEDVSITEVQQFFAKQNQLLDFASIQIEFNRANLTVKLSRSQSFTPESIAKEFERFGISDNVTFESDKIIYNNIRFDADYSRFQIAVKGYGTHLTTKVEKQAKRIVITLHPMSVSGAWSLLEGVVDCGGITYTTFVSRKRQRLGVRYRILAKGIGIDQLAQVEFVNIYATHSSVPREHYKYFDIEAARDYIHSELVLNVGGDIGDRHLALISDVMCYMGNTIKLKLSGKRATNSGPLATAYVEQTLKLLMDSAAGYQTDDLKSAVGMTLIGDFKRGEYGGHGDRKEVEKVESAIDILMTSTVTTRTVAKPKPQQVQQKASNPTYDEKINYFADE